MLCILYPMICHISYAVECRYLHIQNRSADTARTYLSLVYLHKVDARLFGSKSPTLSQNKRHKRYYNMFDLRCVYKLFSECCFVKCSCRLKLIFQKKKYNWLWTNLINLTVIGIWVFNVFLEKKIQLYSGGLFYWSRELEYTENVIACHKLLTHFIKQCCIWVHLATCGNHNISGTGTDLLHWCKYRSIPKRWSLKQNTL